MLKKYQILIVKRYLKAFFTIFIGLTVFFTGVDFASNLDSLPDSANLKVLFSVNRLMYFSTFTFGLSLMFGLISSMVSLIKENELVVMYSFGASKKLLLKPFLFTIGVFIALFLFLNNQPFYVSAVQVAENIKKYGQVSKYEKNLFLKSAESYIFISQLNKYKKEGKNIEIFETKGIDLKRVIKAKRGVFQDNYWLLEDVKIIEKPSVDDTILDKKLKITHKKNMRVLDGFKPAIMDSLYKGSQGLTISDNIEALFLLKDKGLSTTTIKANLYQVIFFPLFSLFLGIILFFKLPIQRRGKNLMLLSAKLYFIALIVWGILYMLIQISKNGAVLPEIGILLPIVLLAYYAYFYYKKKTNSF
jgi:lipopolysaccharide export system permease protein